MFCSENNGKKIGSGSCVRESVVEQVGEKVGSVSSIDVLLSEKASRYSASKWAGETVGWECQVAFVVGGLNVFQTRQRVRFLTN